MSVKSVAAKLTVSGVMSARPATHHADDRSEARGSVPKRSGARGFFRRAYQYTAQKEVSSAATTVSRALPRNSATLAGVYHSSSTTMDRTTRSTIRTNARTLEDQFMGHASPRVPIQNRYCPLHVHTVISPTKDPPRGQGERRSGVTPRPITALWPPQYAA